MDSICMMCSHCSRELVLVLSQENGLFQYGCKEGMENFLLTEGCWRFDAAEVIEGEKKE